MKNFKRTIALLLCICLLAITFVSCGAQGEPMMSLADKVITLNTYQLLLSRMKGTLGYYGYNVNRESFWKTTISADGMTWDDYFCTVILEEASRYLISDYLFDRNGLVFSSEREEFVNQLMDALVKKAGSKTKLNEDLKQFGANYDILRELYVLESKIDMLKDHLYGKNAELISDEDKQEYLENNYVAFGQILLPSYYYLIDKDRFGDSVYYTDKDHKKIAYDKSNGKTKTDEYGKTILDVLGDPEYFNEEGKIAYDTKNGVLGYVTDKDGNNTVGYYDKDVMGEKYELATKYANDCSGDVDKFLEYAALYDESESVGETMYLFMSAGYYGAQNESVSYLDDIAKALNEMKVGECKVVESDYGYHIVCKYEIEEKAYSNEKYKDTFTTFADNITQYFYQEECKKYENSLTIHTDVVKKAPTMMDVLATTLY